MCVLCFCGANDVGGGVVGGVGVVGDVVVDGCDDGIVNVVVVGVAVCE